MRPEGVEVADVAVADHPPLVAEPGGGLLSCSVLMLPDWSPPRTRARRRSSTVDRRLHLFRVPGPPRPGFWVASLPGHAG